MNPPDPTRRAATDFPNKELRCQCGSLLGRIDAAGIELKCRRCRRLVHLRWSIGAELSAESVEIRFADGSPAVTVWLEGDDCACGDRGAEESGETQS